MEPEAGPPEFPTQGKEDKKKRKHKDKPATMSLDEFNQMNAEKPIGFSDGLFHILIHVLNKMI